MGDLSGERTLGGGAGAREKWSLAEGDTLGGYKIIRPLARGGMGEVYLVENELTRKQYALKLLPAELSKDRGFRDRFAREAAVLQEFHHDGIVQVHHAAEEDGRFFLTMDYVDGGSLDERLTWPAWLWNSVMPLAMPTARASSIAT
jgi:serine/threonine protein kinase